MPEPPHRLAHNAFDVAPRGAAVHRAAPRVVRVGQNVEGAFDGSKAHRKEIWRRKEYAHRLHRELRVGVAEEVEGIIGRGRAIYWPAPTN